jgi:hypothetical protein
MARQLAVRQLVLVDVPHYPRLDVWSVCLGFCGWCAVVRRGGGAAQRWVSGPQVLWT